MSDASAIVAFAAAIALLVLLIAKFKIHPVATLFVVVCGLGLALGFGPTKTLDLVTSGFGDTMSGIGLVVIFGCVLGRMLEAGGAAQRITDDALRWFRGRKIPWAVAVASAVIGIPLIADTVVLMLIPIVSVIAARSRISMMRLGPILYIGAYVMTSLIPPGPGPLAAAGVLEIDMGEAMLFGLAVAVPGIVVATLYLSTIRTHVDPKPEFISTADGGTAEDDGQPALEDGQSVSEGRQLPGPLRSLLPILLPITLIMLASYLTDPDDKHMSAPEEALSFIGQPTVALFLGCVAALPLFGARWRHKDTVNGLFESGLKLAALPLALTGTGGALAMIVKEAEIADSVADAIEGWGLSPIVVPFLVAAAICTITGSNILGMMTATALVQPLLGQLDMTPLAAYLACGTGAQIMKHANSSGFWVTTTLSNLTVGQGIRSVGVASALSGITGFGVLYALYGLGYV